MKHTPMIDRALARASNVGAPLHQSVIDAWAKEPGCAYAHTHYRLEQQLKARAAAFEERERHNELYRYYLKKGDRSEARHYQPSQLQDSTTRLKERLVLAYRDLIECEAMPITPFVRTESKRWQKSQRFFQIVDAENAIRRQGGKVRHAARAVRRGATRFLMRPLNEPDHATSEQPDLFPKANGK